MKRTAQTRRPSSTSTLSKLQFTQEFSPLCLGHKLSELLMGIQFAETINLTYVLNKESFLGSSRDADLNWIMGPLQRRFPTLASSERGLNQWARVSNYLGNTLGALKEYRVQHFDTSSCRVFYGGVATGRRLLEEWPLLLQLSEESTGLVDE